MAAQQKRLLTSAKSPLTNLKPSDLAVSNPPTPFLTPNPTTHTLHPDQTILTHPDAWNTLPPTTRTHLYTLLPQPKPNETPYNPDVNPMQTPCRPYIEEELARWQEDLANGFETQKWRHEAMVAGKERMEGGCDEWKEAHREEVWGVKDEEGGAVEGKEEGNAIENEGLQGEGVNASETDEMGGDSAVESHRSS
ncbi:hypothetical protein B0A50_07778 [Salinomyces thailandicus]|uniref:ASX DEUBAD domain-containing protein n=1 Tax=Salinomyces thailandicus TaxID=706561 RepID=A0A4U0TLZ2_9PEZI|nr:hypothetical protein B0A50_07778 [Salinomyces thailandica]